MAKLRGTEAEIHARLRELTERLRQIRKELIESSIGRPDMKGNAADRPRPAGGDARPSKSKRS